MTHETRINGPYEKNSRFKYCISRKETDKHGYTGWVARGTAQTLKEAEAKAKELASA